MVAVVPEVWACLGQPLSREWSVCAHRVTEAYDLVPVKRVHVEQPGLWGLGCARLLEGVQQRLLP